MPTPVIPTYGEVSLRAVLPGIARALGVPVKGPAIAIPDITAACLVLIDGLGAQLLDEAADDAPFLTSLRTTSHLDDLPGELRVGCPTTTATSMGTLGTGVPPGQHGMIGYQVRDPDRGVLLNHLRWDPYTEPTDWQPHRTVFQQMAAAGVTVTNIGAAEFAGSGLTVAAYRGAAFTGAKTFSQRVSLAIDTVEPNSLTYLYWGNVDALGHEFGWRSEQWRTALRAADRQVARLAKKLPAGTLLIITADHGMVDVAYDHRLDIAQHPELRDGIAVLAGEPRMLQIYCRASRSPQEIAARFTDVIADRAWVRTRDEAIAEGWFGPVSDRVRPRIGDVLIAAREDFAIVDSELANKKSLALIGHHGSLTEAEQLVPFIVTRL